MKHAYLILAHNNFSLLRKLLYLLDDERNDIFVHIDKNTKDFRLEDISIETLHSNLYFIDRKKVFWADYSIVDVELDLLQVSTSNATYSYYHLLSGADLPIKTQTQIHKFFDGRNEEFIGMWTSETSYSRNRLKYYHLFTGIKKYRNSNFLKCIDVLLQKIQKLVHIDRLKDNKILVVDGWQWFSITDDFARYVLSKRRYIEDTFSKSIASDELVMQTMIKNSEFIKRVYSPNNLMKGSLRLIDWKRGRPYTFRSEDFDELISSKDTFFARKFDPKVDSDIINRVFEYIDQKQKRGE